MTAIGKSIAYLIIGIALAFAGIGKALWWLVKTTAKGLRLTAKYSGLTVYWIFRALLWELPKWTWQEPLTLGAQAFWSGLKGPFTERAAQRTARKEQEYQENFLRTHGYPSRM